MQGDLAGLMREMQLIFPISAGIISPAQDSSFINLGLTPIWKPDFATLRSDEIWVNWSQIQCDFADYKS